MPPGLLVETPGLKNQPWGETSGQAARWQYWQSLKVPSVSTICFTDGWILNVRRASPISKAAVFGMEPAGILVLHHQFLSISRWLFRCLTQMIIPSLPLYTHHVQQSNYAGGKLNSWLQLAPRFLAHWAHWVPRVSKKPWVVMPWCTYPE